MLESLVILSRDNFRFGVFERDNNRCVICNKPAKDAHHIMERRLFLDGGYYLDNGASLCEKHHIAAEDTTLSTEDIRTAAKIKTVIIPEHLYPDYKYDKWGNIILSDGNRVKGELFGDGSVQKILKQGGVLELFGDLIKYPRTFHIPSSPGATRDDRQLNHMRLFEGKPVVIFEKMDGENTSLYPHTLHARSLSSGSHPSRNLIKDMWAQFGYNIPKGWRVCAENMYAFHSILYSNGPQTVNIGDTVHPELIHFPGGNALDSLLLMFSIWDENNTCLSWDQTKEWCELLELTMCPVLYEGIFDYDLIKKLGEDVEASPLTTEGFVIRLQREFPYGEFRYVTGKYVRKGHVINSHGHWTRRNIVRNEIKV